MLVIARKDGEFVLVDSSIRIATPLDLRASGWRTSVRQFSGCKHC